METPRAFSMTYRLSKWRHPSTMQQRVYINHPDLKTKVWFEESGSLGSIVRCEATTRPQHFPIDIREQQVPDCIKSLVTLVMEEHEIKAQTPGTYNWKDLLKNAE